MMLVTMETAMLLLLLLNLIALTFPAAVPAAIPRFLVDRLHITHKEYNYLHRNGFLRPKDYQFTFEPEEDVPVVRAAISRFQEFYKLPVTGDLDENTRTLMWEPRCGYPDIGEEIHNRTEEGGRWHHGGNHHRVRRYDIAGGRYKWDTNQITWSLVNFPTRGGIKMSELRSTIQRAFEVWSDVTPLTFTELQGHRVNEAMIRIAFLKERHSHDLEHPVFDGPNGDLAHAFSPKSGWGQVNGDIHFDDDDVFTLGNDDRGYNIFQTAAHEIGHALGLDHSNDPSALMWPHYHFMRDFELPKDDILGVQALYGPKGSAPRVDKPILSPQPKPIIRQSARRSYCTSGYSAVTSISGSIYTFKGKHYWRSWRRLLVTPKDGRRIHDKWYNLPANIRAAYQRRDGKTVFFRGAKYWVYYGSEMEPDYPRPVAELGLPKGVDAALAKTKAKTFFFKGNLVWRFDERKMKVDTGYPKPIGKVFAGLDDKITAAFSHDDGNSYLLHGKKYYRIAKGSYAVEPGYPRRFTTDFLGCATVTA